MSLRGAEGDVAIRFPPMRSIVSARRADHFQLYDKHQFIAVTGVVTEWKQGILRKRLFFCGKRCYDVANEREAMSMQFGEAIKKKRESLGLTQQELAEKLFVSRQTVCRWENGSRCPDLVMAKKIALVLGISLDELIPKEAVQDYVVVHELCHRKEMNHSDRFWREVAKVMPDYKIHKKWLKDHGSKIMNWNV